MTYREVRQKFVDFFKGKGHVLENSSSLIPEHDASVLLTTAGMQQFKPYFTGTPFSNPGNKAISVQKCFRMSDIDEVGDETHLTFFEMFGNFAFNGAVSKEQAIVWGWEFLTDPKWIGLDKNRVSATYYNGNRAGTNEDTESKSILEGIDGLKKITPQADEDNFWGPTGDEGPCGPTVEFYVDGVEIWNIVFNEFYCNQDGLLKTESALGVDTGMGLERLLVAVTPEATNVYETDAFTPIIDTIKKHTPGEEIGVTKPIRIIADHLRGSVFLMSDHVQPSNKEQGYILRRLLRRAILHLDKLEALSGFEEIIQSIVEHYADFYPELKTEENMILQLANLEKDKFLQTIKQGKAELEKLINKSSDNEISGVQAFELYATYGIPVDVVKEEIKQAGAKLNETRFNSEFDQEFKKHQEVSRAGIESKFGGHGLSSGAEVSQEDKQKITRLHSATHLLHAALVKFLGDEVKQAGSDLNTERARFDFTFPRKLTPEEKDQIQIWVNEQISQGLPIKKETKPLQEALDDGAVAFFKQKYPDIVDVYTIYNPDTQEVISKELCGGPHVENTSEIGEIEIKKEQSSSAGVRRIKFIIK